MPGLAVAQQFAEEAGKARSSEELAHIVDAAARKIGYRYFAIRHHVDLQADLPGAVLLHNYPASWAEYYLANRLYERDPLCRASERTSKVFSWSEICDLIEITPEDKAIFAAARRQGICDGCTIPVHVPGEPSGSCSFATPMDAEIGETRLLLAQLIGVLAFEAGRRIVARHTMQSLDSVRLTERQRQCLVLAAKGKTDWEIARILGISEETASLHLKMARDRYGVSKRLSLAIRALHDGQISFWEVVD